MQWDRDTNWERTEVAYELLTEGKGRHEHSPFEALDHQYAENPDLTDYYVEPVVLVDADDRPVATLEDGDAFIFWNFRSR